MEMRVLDRDDDITQVALCGRLDTTGAEEVNDSGISEKPGNHPVALTNCKPLRR